MHVDADDAPGRRRMLAHPVMGSVLNALFAGVFWFVGSLVLFSENTMATKAWSAVGFGAACGAAVLVGMRRGRADAERIEEARAFFGKVDGSDE
jgi:hypothetical protein